MAQINCKPAYCWVFIFSAIIILTGCIPEAEKSEGYKLYSAKCSSCHRLLPPDQHPMEKFREYVEKYGKQLAAEEKSKILNFIEEYRKMKK